MFEKYLLKELAIAKGSRFSSSFKFIVPIILLILLLLVITLTKFQVVFVLLLDFEINLL